MKLLRKRQRFCILILLSFSVVAPIVLVSYRFKTLTFSGDKEFIEDLSSIKYRADTLRLSAIRQEAGQGMRVPDQEVYRDRSYSVNSYSADEDLKSQESEIVSNRTVSLGRTGTDRDENDRKKQIMPKEVRNEGKENQRIQRVVSRRHRFPSKHAPVIRRHLDVRPPRRKAEDERIKLMKDQVVRARAYLSFAGASSNLHLVKELKQRIKEVEKALGEKTKDSELSKSNLQRSKNMESALSRASHAYPDCNAMVKKLRAMTMTTEDQVQARRDESAFLTHLAGRTTPKGLHCLSMGLTAEYFSLGPQEKELQNQQNVQNPDLFHFTFFSDNILACVAVVNSTVSNAMEPEKIVFHVITDSLNFPAFSMWFLLNPPGKATIQVLSIDGFSWLPPNYASMLEKQNPLDPRYSSPLNHLRFYLPQIFPYLDKIVLLDHDVVVQRDLRGLWNVDMKGKVNAAVETCQDLSKTNHRMDMLINFSDPTVDARFDVNACTWAFGLNVLDLREWRRQDLSRTYQNYLLMGKLRPLWKAGTLPLGWLVFYDQTVALDRMWQVLGLGYDPGVRQELIEQAAAIHYDGIKKPWLDIGMKKYKSYWNKYLDFDHPYLQRCNIHG